MHGGLEGVVSPCLLVGMTSLYCQTGDENFISHSWWSDRKKALTNRRASQKLMVLSFTQTRNPLWMIVIANIPIMSIVYDYLLNSIAANILWRC